MRCEELCYEIGSRSDEGEDVLVNLELQVNECECGGECVPGPHDLCRFHSLLNTQVPHTFPSEAQGKEEIRHVAREVTKRFFADMGMKF